MSGVNKTTKRESVDLLPADWVALDQIATDLGAVNTRGALAGLPSWRAMLRQIATGKLVVTRPDVYEETALSVLKVIVANATVQPDAAMDGYTDCFAVPFGDIEAAEAAIKRAEGVTK